MLVKKIEIEDFLGEFKKYGRESQFSYNGKKALFEFLNQLSEDTGEPIELDIIGICCNFTEYDSVEDFNDDYGHGIGCNVDSIEDIGYFTLIIPIEGGKSFIIQDF